MSSIRPDFTTAVGRARHAIPYRPLACALAALAIGFVACTSDSPDDTPPAPDGGGPGDDASTDGQASADAQPDGGAGTTPLDTSSMTPGQWRWFDFESTLCRDGSAAGFSVNLGASGAKKVLFFLDAGGACFNPETCATNPDRVLAKSASRGVFDRANSANPFADYTHVFVSYCTGDIHSGNEPNGSIGGVPQKFVGYTNIEHFLQKIAATFPGTERLVMSGISAGGFGATLNYGQARRIFPSIPINLIDDSGPFMRDPRLAHCLQEKWRTAWGLDRSVLAECGADCAGKPDFLAAAAKHWVSTTQNATGLISATGDETIRYFYGFGANDCGQAEGVSAELYAAGLQDIRAQLAEHDNFGTFFYEGTGHTLLSSDKFYSTTIQGKSVASWAREIVQSDAVSNVGP